MTINTQLPLDLYKANLELWQTTGKLLQESGQKWLEQSKQGADLKTLATTAAGNQAALLAGLGAAAQTWQKDSAAALGGGGAVAPLPFNNVMGDFFKQFVK